MAERKTIVMCIVFRKKDDNYEFLLLKRKADGGGFWQPPGGSVEEGESLLDGAYRELEEETGVGKEDVLSMMESVHEFDVDEHYITGEKIEPVPHHMFGAEVDDVDVTIDKNPCYEHDEFRWVNFEDAVKMLQWDNNKEGFDKLNSMLME